MHIKFKGSLEAWSHAPTTMTVPVATDGRKRPACTEHRKGADLALCFQPSSVFVCWWLGCSISADEHNGRFRSSGCLRLC